MSVRTPDVLDASATVRAGGADDVVPIHALAVDNAMFAPDAMAGLAEMLQGYLDGSLDQHRWIVADDPVSDRPSRPQEPPRPDGRHRLAGSAAVECGTAGAGPRLVPEHQPKYNHRLVDQYGGDMPRIGAEHFYYAQRRPSSR